MTQATSVADSSEWSPPEGQARATTVLPPTRTFVEATGRQLPSQHPQRRLAIAERGKTPLRVQQKLPALTTALLPWLNKKRVHLAHLRCGVRIAAGAEGNEALTIRDGPRLGYLTLQIAAHLAVSTGTGPGVLL